MKSKLTILFMTLLLLSSMLSVLVNAETVGEQEENRELSAYDSINLSPEELALLEEKEYITDDLEFAVKIYNQSIGWFVQNKTIEEIIQRPNNGDYYMYYDLDSDFYPWFYPKGDWDGSIDVGSNDFGIIPQLLERNNIFSSVEITRDIETIEVLRTYCFADTDVFQLYIYFITNHGDYVFVMDHPNDSNGYLLPRDIFYEHVANFYTIYQMKQKNIDLTSYEYNIAQNSVEPPPASSETPPESSEITAPESSVTQTQSVPEASSSSTLSGGNNGTASFDPIHLLWIIPSVIIVLAAVILLSKKKK